MINIKNILKVLLIALFVCVYSGEVAAQQSGGDTNSSATEQASQSGNSQLDPTFCSTDLGIFTDLVRTGQTIFNRLRDLIYVVAGFGIIAVAVGGFFGNLNWKWLGAIIISLVVMATAGEIVVLITGCEKFDDNLITNTLSEPTSTLDASYGRGKGENEKDLIGSATVREYNEFATRDLEAETTEIIINDKQSRKSYFNIPKKKKNQSDQQEGSSTPSATTTTGETSGTTGGTQ